MWSNHQFFSLQSWIVVDYQQTTTTKRKRNSTSHFFFLTSSQVQSLLKWFMCQRFRFSPRRSFGFCFFYFRGVDCLLLLLLCGIAVINRVLNCPHLFQSRNLSLVVKWFVYDEVASLCFKKHNNRTRITTTNFFFFFFFRSYSHSLIMSCFFSFFLNHLHLLS